MANTDITILGQIKPGGFTGVADVNDIAYSYKTEGGIEQMDKSLKDKLDELQNNIPSGLEESLDSISQQVTQASGYATNARQYAVDAQAANQNAQSAKSDVTALRQQVETLVNTTSEDINFIKGIAQNFSGVIDSTSEFAIVTESDYNKMKNGQDGMALSPNTIYFCYDPNQAQS